MNTHIYPIHPSLSASEPWAWPVPVEYRTDAAIGTLMLPDEVRGLVLLAYFSVGAHQRSRNHRLARCLTHKGLAVLQADLRTLPRDKVGKEASFQGDPDADLGRFAGRLASAVQGARQQPDLCDLPIGCLGFGVGGTAALMVAGSLTAAIDALVVADSQPDLIGDRLPSVLAATLLMVSNSHGLQHRMNEIAYARLRCEKKLEVVPGIGNSVNGDSMEEVAGPAATWFQQHLQPRTACDMELKTKK